MHNKLGPSVALAAIHLRSLTRSFVLALMATALLALGGGAVAQEDSAGQAMVYFVSPLDGSMVSPEFEVEMAVHGLEVQPAGAVKEGAGHMHVLVDTPFIEPGKVIPSDDQHIHLGDGSTKTTLALKPGGHTLRLQFADGKHRALEGPEYRDQIEVRVAKQ